MYDYLPGFATEEDQKKLLQEYDELDKFDQIQKLKNKKNEVLQPEDFENMPRLLRQCFYLKED